MKYIILLLAALAVTSAVVGQAQDGRNHNNQSASPGANTFGAGLGISVSSVGVLCILPQLVWISVFIIATRKAKKLKLRSVTTTMNQNPQIVMASDHQGQITAPPYQLHAQTPVFLPPTAQLGPVPQQAPTNTSHFNNSSVPYSSAIASSETNQHLMRPQLTSHNVVPQSVPMNSNVMATNLQQTVVRQHLLRNPAPIQTTPQSTPSPPAHETALTNIMTSSNPAYIATAVSLANVRVATQATPSTRPLSDAGSYVDVDGYTPMFPNH